MSIHLQRNFSASHLSDALELAEKYGKDNHIRFNQTVISGCHFLNTFPLFSLNATDLDISTPLLQLALSVSSKLNRKYNYENVNITFLYKTWAHLYGKLVFLFLQLLQLVYL